MAGNPRYPDGPHGKEHDLMAFCARFDKCVPLAEVKPKALPQPGETWATEKGWNVTIEQDAPGRTFHSKERVSCHWGFWDCNTLEPDWGVTAEIFGSLTHRIDNLEASKPDAGSRKAVKTSSDETHVGVKGPATASPSTKMPQPIPYKKQPWETWNLPRTRKWIRALAEDHAAMSKQHIEALKAVDERNQTIASLTAELETAIGHGNTLSAEVNRLQIVVDGLTRERDEECRPCETALRDRKTYQLTIEELESDAKRWRAAFYALAFIGAATFIGWAWFVPHVWVTK